MSAVSFFVLLGAVVALVFVAGRLKAWGFKIFSALCIFALAILAIWVVDGYFVKLDTPLGPPVAEDLESAPSEVPEPESLKLEAEDPRPDMDQVREEHRKKLDDFGERSL